MTVPPLTHLYVNPAGECNLACSHCWITPGRSGAPFSVRERLEEEFTPEQFRELLDRAAALGLKNLKFTGGEPLLRSDFPLLYRAAAEHPAGLFVNIETNGTLEPEGIWEAFEEHPPGSVAVSLDSAVPEVHDDFRNTPGAFRKTVSFIEKLVSREVNTQVIASTVDFRVEPVLEIARLCRDMGVGSLKVNPVQPIGRGAKLHGSGTRIENILSFARNIHETCGRSVAVDVPPAFLPIDRLRESGRCPLQNLLGVLASGDVSFCGIGFICGELVMGNFITGDLERIWREHPLPVQVRTLLPGELEGICGNCIHSSVCLGSCVMQNYYSTGRFTAPFWVCSEAEKEGLFPNTRKIRPDA